MIKGEFLRLSTRFLKVRVECGSLLTPDDGGRCCNSNLPNAVRMTFQASAPAMMMLDVASPVHSWLSLAQFSTSLTPPVRHVVLPCRVRPFSRNALELIVAALYFYVDCARCAAGYRPEKKVRCPSWCDRVLYTMGMQSGDSVRRLGLERYWSSGPLVSDHMPGEESSSTIACSRRARPRVAMKHQLSQ